MGAKRHDKNYPPVTLVWRALIWAETAEMFVNNFTRQIVMDINDKLDGWVNALATAAPLLPPIYNPDLKRPELREHRPWTVMIGKCVRAVSGFRAALVLVNSGYVTECTSIMRMVSDFCDEIITIGIALQGRDELPKSVRDLVEGYFAPTPLTPDQYEQAKRPHRPSRKDLMKVQEKWAEMENIDGQKMREIKTYLNNILNAYVHGAYETTMELYDRRTGYFRMRGFQSLSESEHHVNTMHLMLHSVVGALQITAAVTSHREVWQATRETLHALDRAGWSLPPTEGIADATQSAESHDAD